MATSRKMGAEGLVHFAYGEINGRTVGATSHAVLCTACSLAPSARQNKKAPRMLRTVKDSSVN